MDWDEFAQVIGVVVLVLGIVVTLATCTVMSNSNCTQNDMQPGVFGACYERSR